MKKFDTLLREAHITRPDGYDFYFRNYIYRDIDLDNKKIRPIVNIIARIQFAHFLPIIFHIMLSLLY